MPGIVKSWPAWPEFSDPTPESMQDGDFARAIADIIAQYGEQALRQGWLKACKELEKVTARLSSPDNAAVPIFQMDEIQGHGLSEKQRLQLRSSGCCIIRGVLDTEEASAFFKDLKSFISDNEGRIMGWPPNSPSIYRLYNSPTQIAVRTHPNQLFIQSVLNSLYHDVSGETSPNPLSYTDAARIRPPGQPFLGLGPHIDAGSLCRWADPAYRKVYDRIFAGYPEEFDAYDLGTRKDADQFLFQARAHSEVFRAFQGWTALTSASAACGTLMLYPNVSAVIAYVVLRPFFSPPSDSDEIMDATKWTFNSELSWFPGTMKDQSQRLSIYSHPHLRLQDCVQYIPPMNPGDTVWWHTDVSFQLFRPCWFQIGMLIGPQMCHAVDPEHNGTEDASVVYVAACPTTPKNKAYIKRQLEAALAGKAPPDVIGMDVNETTLKGYKGYDNVSKEGRTVLGFDLL
jgi:hypothetical protein